MDAAAPEDRGAHTQLKRERDSNTDIGATVAELPAPEDRGAESSADPIRIADGLRDAGVSFDGETKRRRRRGTLEKLPQKSQQL